MTQKSLSLPVCLWLGAFICALYPINNWQLESYSLAIVLIFTWTHAMLSRDIGAGWKLSSSPVLKFAGAFWLLVLLSAFWSQIKPISLTAVCLFSVMPLTFFAGVMAGRADYFKKIAYALAALFGVLALWAMFQFFFLNNYFHGQARHPLADPSSLGALFSLALFCSIGWMISDTGKRSHVCSVVLSALLVCGIMATVARGPVFAFIPAFVFFCVLLWPRVKARWKSFLAVILCGLAFYGLMQLGLQKRYDLGERLMGTVSAENNISAHRIDIWSSAVDIIKEHPVLGTGIGTFFLYYPEHRRVTETDGVFMAHNDPLQFFVELGPLGPLLFYAFVIAAALRSFSALKVAKDGDKIIIASLFCALAAMVVHSHVSFNHYNLSILLMTGLFLSVWFLKTGEVLQESTCLTAMPDKFSPSMSKALLVLPFLMMGWLFLSVMGGEYMTNKARDDFFAQRMQDFAKHINLANNVSHGMNYRAYLFAVNVPIAILADRRSTLNEDQQKKLYDQAVDYMNIVLALNPRSAGAYFYLGKVQTLVDPSVIPKDTKSIEDYYKEAVRLDPMLLGARMGLYQIYKEQNKSTDELIAFMEPASGFYYTTPVVMEYYGEMARLYLEAGNYDKAKQMMSAAVEFKRRSDYSAMRQDTSIPEAIRGGDAKLPVY